MLIEALGLEGARLISLCGAGGKTSLMFALAREFVSAGERILITTTTKIARDEAAGPWPSFAAATVEEVLENAQRLLPDETQGRRGAIIAFSARDGNGARLVGFASELVDRLGQSRHFDRILVEADGSARKPLKAPAAHEPVIPSTTDALVIVAGLNGLGLALDEEHLFRAEIWARLSGIELGSAVTAESLARVVVHAEGLTRGCPATARKVLFLNRADSPERLVAAKQVIGFLNATTARRPDRIVSGYLLPEPNIAEVVPFPELSVDA